MRLGTASLASQPGGPFIATARLNLKKYAARPALGRALADYIIYVDHDMRAAAELAAAAVAASKGSASSLGSGLGGGSSLGSSSGAGRGEGVGSCWWWRARLGKALFHLGLMREAERQFALSLEQQVG